MDNFFLDIDNLFDTFVENINTIPFNEIDEYSTDPIFMLNQNIINNAYLLRRSFELNANTSNINANTNNANANNRNANANNRNANANNRNANANTNTNNINANTNTNNILNEALYVNTPTYDIFSSLFTNFNDFIEEQIRLQEELEDVKITISDEDFKRLNTIILDESVLKNSQCSICLENMLLSDKLIILKCNHIYHNNCLKQWVTNNSSKCCVCRFDIRDELNE